MFIFSYPPIIFAWIFRHFFVFVTHYVQGVPKCPGHIWYVNDNLVYLHRLPHVRFPTFFTLVLNLRWVNDVSVHKLSYH